MANSDAPKSAWPAILAIGYAAVVLAVDTLAVKGYHVGIDWRLFLWQLPGGIDLFKLAAWLLIPLLISLPGMDWAYFGIKRWRRIDWATLGGLAAVCLAVVLAIPWFPSLRATYHGVGNVSVAAKAGFAVGNILWTISWLTGWEFLHRYFLLTRLNRQWPRYGWLLIPIYEGAYHLQKPLLEAFGMVLFSILLTQWALRRRNTLLPFLAHLAIELELIAFLVMT